MPDTIGEYHVVRFRTAAEAGEIAWRIMNFIATTAGAVWMRGPGRAVLWIGGKLRYEGTLYLSDGAVEAARAAGISLGGTQRVPVVDLPADRTLLAGDERDRNGGASAQR